MKWIGVRQSKPPLNEEVFIHAKNKTTGESTVCKATWSDKNIFDPDLKTQPYWLCQSSYFLKNNEITHWAQIELPIMVEIGDEVRRCGLEGFTFYVTAINYEKEECGGLLPNGKPFFGASLRNVKKTGRHSDTLEQWAIGEEKE